MNERMTKRDTDGQAMMDCEKCKADWTGKHGKPMADCTALYCRNRLLGRLVEYEDTGLTPEEIKAPFTEDTMINLAAQALGVEPSRLRELAEADKVGRCVVLPCEVGEKIYYLNGKYIIEVDVVGYKIDETGAWLFIGETYNPETNRAYHCDLETERIGKTVFFTREEAERAVEGRKDG